MLGVFILLLFVCIVTGIQHILMSQYTTFVAQANLPYLSLDGLLKYIKLNNKYVKDKSTNTNATINTYKKVQTEDSNINCRTILTSCFLELLRG